MKISTLFTVVSIATLTLAPSFVAAQGFTGSISLGAASIAGVSPDGSNQDQVSSFVALDFDGDFEMINGWYFGGGVSYGEGTLTAGPHNEFYMLGYSVNLRAGRDFSWGAGEVFGGYAEADGNDGLSGRYFYGAAAGFEFAEKWTLNGQIGYMDGVENSSAAYPDNGDALRQAVFGGIGVGYQITDSFGLNLGVFGASGTMDQDDDRAQIIGVSLGVDYRLPSNPNWELYAEVVHTQYSQFDENDFTNHTSIGMGVTYHFGDTSPRAALGNSLAYAEWMAVTGADLE